MTFGTLSRFGTIQRQSFVQRTKFLRLNMRTDTISEIAFYLMPSSDIRFLADRTLYGRANATGLRPSSVVFL